MIGCTAVVKVFPPLYEIGSNMATNYASWGERRKMEFQADAKLTADARAEECRKLDERIAKFREKLAFTEDLKARMADARKQRRDSGTTK